MLKECEDYHSHCLVEVQKTSSVSDEDESLGRKEGEGLMTLFANSESFSSQKAVYVCM